MKKLKQIYKEKTSKVLSYKRDYVIDASKDICARGMALIIEGEILMNIITWRGGTKVSPRGKMEVAIEWLKDLTALLEEGLDG